MQLTANITPFPHTPEPSTTNDHYDNLLSQLVSSSTTRTHASTRTREEQDLAAVARHYEACLGVRCPPPAMRQLAMYLHDGIEAAMLMQALEDASEAPRPSWAYARAIIEACIREGVTTIEDYYGRQISWRMGRR